MLPSYPMRLTLCLALAAVVSILAGCKPKANPPATSNPPPMGAALQASTRPPPGTAELAAFVRSGLPPTIKLVDLKNDPPVPMPDAAPGSNAWLYNVRLTFAAVEDELGPPAPQDAQAFQSLLNELDGLVAWSQAYAKSPYASRYPSVMVEPLTPAAPQLLRVLHAKGQPHAPIYGKLAAEWQVDHWAFSMEDLALPKDEGGKFRSELTGPILIQGEAATARYVAQAKAAVAQAKEKKAAVEAAYQADLRQATLPGTVYKGSIGLGGKASPSIPAEVRFTTSPGNDPSVAAFELHLPASGYVYTCTARLAQRVPNLPVAAATATSDTFAPPPEPAPQGDLAISYEHVNHPKFNPADELANSLLYNHSGIRNAPLTLRDHQLTGKLTNLPYGFLVLSVQQNP